MRTSRFLGKSRAKPIQFLPRGDTNQLHELHVLPESFLFRFVEHSRITEAQRWPAGRKGRYAVPDYRLVAILVERTFAVGDEADLTGLRNSEFPDESARSIGGIRRNCR